MAITFKKKYKDEMTGEWACPVCELKLDSQHSFTVHIRQHNPTDHSHTCSICNKQLSSASSLDRHMLIHSGERPFGCSICGMKFTTNGNCHRHMRTHTQDQQQAVGYITSTTDDDGIRIRSKKKRKTKSLPNSNSPSNTNAQSQNSSFGFDDLSIKEGFLALLQLQNRPFDTFNFDNADNSAAMAAATNFYSQLPKPLNQLSLNGASKQLLSKKDKLLINDDLDESSEHRSTTSSEEQQENLLNKNGNGLYHDDEINKLAFKRSLTQNSTLYNTLLNNSLTAAASAINGNANNKSDLADINSILSVISSVTPMLQNVTSDLQQQLPSLSDEQMAKINQITLQQQALQDQSTLLNNNLTPGKQAGKRSRNNNQSNGSLRGLTNSASNGKRMKKESKTTNNDFANELSSLANLSSLNNLTNLTNLTASLNSLKNSSINSSLNSINNLINGQADEDRKSDEGSDKSVKNGSDIENEMINSKLNSLIKSADASLKNSTTSQSLLNNSQQTLEHDDTMDDEDEVNLSEEEEANKLEQELCEQIKKEESKSNLDNESKSDKLEMNDEDDDKKDDLQKDLSDDLFKNADLSSLIVPKKTSGISENLADLLIKSDKNNNKNMRNNNGSVELNQRVFIDPMVEDDVKLLERQLQDQQYLCKICHLEVRSVNTLRRHQRLHDAGGQLYKCHYCQYTSLDKSSLIRHLRTHNGERPYTCLVCRYAFTTKANCERHVRKRHKKQNKSEIRVSMQFKVGGGNSTDGLMISSNGTKQTGNNNNQSDQFSSSTSVLDNIPPSSLVETNKSLLASSNMHLIPHVFYEPNSMETRCRYCNIDFSFNRLLKQHVRTMVNNNFTKKPFNCILCNQGFTTKNVCVRHFEKAHKDVRHDQIQSMIMEISIESDEQRLANKFNGLNASALAAFSSTTGSGSSELMSNGDSSELDQPMNLASSFYNGNLNRLNLTNDKYIDDEDEYDDEDNSDALDLSVKPNDRQSTLNLGNNNQLNDAETIRNAINTLLALQSVMPKTNQDNQPATVPGNLFGQSLNLNNMSNLLAAQQLQNNSTSGSLLNLFNSLI